MKTLKNLFENNRNWAQTRLQQDPGFFNRLKSQQTPNFLWIGCADSRVPANEIIGLDPGEVFVHRNIANVVVHSDLNCLSVIQYAVEYLKVEHIIVCGHYGCGGVAAALGHQQLGLIDNWLRHIKDIYVLNHQAIDSLASTTDKVDRLCELNVAQQVANVCHTSIVQDAWRAGRKLNVHGWIYSIADGLLKDLNLCVDHSDQIDPIFRTKV